MNRQQLVETARRIIDKRRFDAEADCEKLLSELRKDPSFKMRESDLRRAQLRGDAREITACKEKLAQILASRNLTEADLKPRYACPRCNDTGYVNNATCSCLEQEICRLITSESNVINRDFTFDNSAERDRHNVAVYNKARQLCDEGKGNLLLVGNTGSGKTYLMTACVNRVISQNRSVLFTTAYSLNALFLEARLSNYRTCQSIMDALTDVEALAIDDLGTEINYKNVTAEYLFTLINERITRRKQTFISTNLTLASLRDRYDERLFSRLVDANITTVAELKGADKRIKKS